MTSVNLTQFKEDSQNHSRTNKSFLENKRWAKTKFLDDTVHEFHYEAFEHINCLDCANCCKTTSPILIDRDIDRISKHLKITPSKMIDQYMELDGDDEYVFRQIPCPFLMADNYCLIYDVRPRACREYPHTNRKRVHKLFKLTWRNSLVCPAVLEIVDRMKEKYLTSAIK